MQEDGEGSTAETTAPAQLGRAGPRPLPSLPSLFAPGPQEEPASAVPVPELVTSDFALPVSGRHRHNMGARVIVLVAGVVLAAIVGGVVAMTGGSAGPSPIQSPIDANAQLFAAANSSGSFHYVSDSSGMLGGREVTQTQTGDVGRSEGTQFMSSNVGNYEVRVINSTAYLRADLGGLESTFGYTPSEAAPFVNQWIEFTPSDQPYAAIAEGVTSASVWGNPSESPVDQLPQTPQAVSTPSDLGGRSVQTVTYLMHGTKSTTGVSFTGTERIAFAANAPHLPYSLREQLSGNANGQSASGTSHIAFSQWGKPVDVAVPTSSVPFSSLPSPSTLA